MVWPGSHHLCNNFIVESAQNKLNGYGKPASERKNLSGGPNDRPTWGAGMLEAWEFVEANVTPVDCWGPQGSVVFYHSRLGREQHCLPPALALCCLR